MSFVHLHVHSEFSLSSSLVKMDKLLARCREENMPAVAVTDWCNLYGSLYLNKAAKDSGVKPIYGMEIGVQTDSQPGAPLRHLVLLAKSNLGYRSLSAISTAAHSEFGLDGEVLRPRMPLTRLIELAKDLIVLTGGVKGLVSSYVVQDQLQEAEKYLSLLKEAFAGSLYLELQDAGFSFQRQLNSKLVEWGQRFDVPVVATNDVHYLSPEDGFAQEVWMMVAQKLSLEQNPTSGHQSRGFYLKSAQEMREAFAEIPQACDNTLLIAEQCNVSFKFKDETGKRIFHLPDFSSEGQDQNELFRAEVQRGLENRFSQRTDFSEAQKQQYRERLQFETQTIIQMGFAGYYLIVSDFIRYAKKNGIPVGPGRGSGAGSLAAFVLDITDLDPMEYGLLFERFLNPERVSLPDFDIDFCQARRAEVIQYVSQKYGKDRVCQIVTFAKEQSKNAIKDVGRVMGLSFAETNRLTKFIPSVQMKPLTIEESLNEVPEFKAAFDTDPKVRQVVETAIRLEGSLRQPGVHAAGVIISSQPVAQVAPMSVDQAGNRITQWDMKMSEEAGLVKFDFLGLVTLDLMDLACQWIRKRPEPECQNLFYDTIPIDDPRAFDLVARGDTLGVFQFESTGMQNLCTRIKPDRFGDLCAINALFRPGPLESGMVDDFIARKQGKAKVEVMFPEMEPILRETYGVIVYQEQVQEIAKAVAGYTLGGADLLRRAMGKKDAKEMDKQRAGFVQGCVSRGKPADKAGQLFDTIEKFAGYGFNKSHAAAYVKLAVQTAFLKAVYPTEFFTALLTIEKEDTDRLSRYISDARVRGLEVLPPDINESEVNFSIVSHGRIRFGLSAIKNVGEAAVEAILEAKKKGPFKDLFDFASRVDLRRVNKRTVECLIQAGAFDSLGTERLEHRSLYLANVEKALEWAGREAASAESGQASLFGEASSGAGSRPEMVRAQKNLSDREALQYEKDLLGIYLSGSPLDRYKDRAKTVGAKTVFSLSELKPKTPVVLSVMVAELREVRVKKGKRIGESMAILKLEDDTSQVEAVSFPDHYKEFQALLKSGNPLVVRGELDFEEERPKILLGEVVVAGQMSVEDLTQVEKRWPKKLRVHVDLERIDGVLPYDLLFSEMQKLLLRYQGSVPVELKMSKAGAFLTTLELDARYSVQPMESLEADLAGLVTVPGSLHLETIH